MKTEDTVEYNSLRWVKKELDLILSEAQISLSTYIEDNNEADRLRECIDHLHMVQGTLQMVELFGAAQLAEEMEHVAAAVLNNDIEKTDDAYDVLMRSMLQLPDYLESLQAGSKDVPMILLPLLNDLRASRNANLLSENVLFFPDVDNATEHDEVDSSVELLPVIKKLRPHYLMGLLGWFKGEKVQSSLNRMLAVLAEFEKNTSVPSTKRLWTISAALIEGLLHQGIDSNVSIKMILGHVDRSIKQLLDEGEEKFASNVSSELLKNLLYYVARINKDTERVSHVKQLYKLSELLPNDEDLDAARSGMGGLNSELLVTVSQGIREDMLEVKDVLELFVHTETREVSKLESLPELLRKIADTLIMLGLGGPREIVIRQQEKIIQIIDGSLDATDEEIMNIAGELLSVEAQLNSFIAKRAGSDHNNDVFGVVGDLGDMPEAEYTEVLSAVIKEALLDFNEAKQSILSYIENSEDKDYLEIIDKSLTEVSGAMFMLPIKRLEPLLDALKNYVNKVLLSAGQVPGVDEQNDIADVITSIEYYLEALLEGRPDIDNSLSAGEEAAKRLDEISNDINEAQQEQSEVAPQAIEDVSVDAEEALAEEPALDIPDEELDIDFELDESPEEESLDIQQSADVEPDKNTEPESEAISEAVVPDRQEFIILSDDADEEILEIFIEEALEVLESLNEEVPRWSANTSNEEPLMTIRRSFHTLKGSGRLIGAELIGEFSWAFEDMLNRVIDKSRPVNQDVFDVLEESLGVIPQLIEQLKGNRDPVTNVYELFDRVVALGKWDKSNSKVKLEEKKPAAKVSAPEPEQIPANELLEEEINQLATDDEIEVDLALEENLEIDQSIEEIIELEETDELLELEEDLSEQLLLEDEPEIIEVSDTEALDEGDLELIEEDDDLESEFDIDLTEDLEALQMAITSDDDTAETLLIEEDDEELMDFSETSSTEIEDEVPIVEDQLTTNNDSKLPIHLDPVLFEIFNRESESHLNKIRELLAAHQNAEQQLVAGPELIRALHTLYGSARTAEVDEIAALCGEMEKYTSLLQGSYSPNFNDEGVHLLEEMSQAVGDMLILLADPSNKLIPDTALINRIKQQIIVLAEQEAKIEQATGGEVVVSSDEESLVSYSEVDEELVDIFLEEAEELLDGCENSLQRWSKNNDDKESVNDLQRQLHTLKGGARMADLAPVGDLTHVLETLIGLVCDGRVDFSKDMSGLLHESMDRLSEMLNKVKNREPVSSASELINDIDLLSKGEYVKKKVDEEDESELELVDQEPVLHADIIDEVEIEDDLEEELKPQAEEEEFSLQIDGTDLENEFSIEETKLDASVEQILEPEIVFEETDGESDELNLNSDISEEIQLQSDHVEDIDFESGQDSLDEDSASFELLIEEEPEEPEEPEEMAELDLDKDLEIDESNISHELVDDEPVIAETAQKTNQKQSESNSTFYLPKKVTEKSIENDPSKTVAHEQVRVRSDLLNDLVNNASEVSVYHARMGQQITDFGYNLSEMDQTVIRLRDQLRKLSNETEAQILSRYEKESDQYDEDFDPLEMDRFSNMQQISRSLQETVADMESIKDILGEDVRDSETLLLQESRASTELQEGLMRTRMVHFGGLASRLRRIVRQTARELNKEIELEIEGETSEVDRTVLDRIIAPLEHMLRNAASHGIEMPDERLAAGKPETGMIKIKVDREGGDVMMTVKDDGRGIDIGAVRNRATERGLIDSDAKLSDHDILQYIMEPGFSTAEHVTQISGRGVGMDVVDSEIKQLGGVLEIDTVQGKGTTFNIRLPLTLAINHALLVNVNEDVYAIPLNSIEGIVRLSGPELQSFYDSEDSAYEFAGTNYELKNLSNVLLGHQDNYEKNMQLYPVLLSHVGDRRVALHVDGLLGRREIVVKPVGPQIASVRGISGATILGDGRVVLIIEMNALVMAGSLFHATAQEDGDQQEVVFAEPVKKDELVVMVVDDSITIRKVTERMLSRNGIKVVTAKDGVDAVAQLQDMIPDVMLLDIEMPRMDGYEVATHVRNDERLKALPIIMITSRSGAKHKEKAMEIGVNKYLGKPYQEDDLMANINDLVG